MLLPSYTVLLLVLLAFCQPLLGVGVNVTQLTRVKLGDLVEIVCRAEQRPGLLLSWWWIANGKVVDLNGNRLPPGALKINSVEKLGSSSITSVVSRIRWIKVPAEASGVYQCRNSNDFRQPIGNTTLIVTTSSRQGDEMRASQENNNTAHIFQSGSAFNLTCLNGDALGPVQWLRPNRVQEVVNYYGERDTPPRSRFPRIHQFIESTSSTPILMVKKASYLDTGYYTCHNKEDVNDINYRQFVYVEDPQHLILPPARQPVGLYGELRVSGYYLESNVEVGCGPTHPSVQVILKKIGDDVKIIASSEKADDLNSTWSFNPLEGFKIRTVSSWELMGLYQCEATWPKSSKKSISNKFQIEIQGVEVLSSFDSSTRIIEGERITLTCRSKKRAVMDFAWRWMPAILPPYQTVHSFLEIKATRLPAGGKGYLLPFENDTSDQDYSPPLGTFQVHRLSWLNFPMEANGIYQCYDATNLNIPVSNITIQVFGSKAPILIDPEVIEEIDVHQGSQFSLKCHDTVAYPKPTVQWFMRIRKKLPEEILDDGHTEYHDINTTYDDRNVTSILNVYYAIADTTYYCRFSNFKGSMEKNFSVSVVHGLGPGIIAAIIMSSIIVVSIILLAFLLKRYYKKKVQKMHLELINNRLRLLEGNTMRIDANSPIEDQLDCLPYDNKYEFPSNRLVLGKQLGTGHFGRVVQAKIIGTSVENTPKVAVKMVKSTLDNTGLTSLASELKILIHLGFHLNVVSLLGACTKNLIKGELMVIVEFCAHGNLQDFLMNNRRHFIDELDSNGDPTPLCEQKAARQMVPNPSSLEDNNPSVYQPRYWSSNSSKEGSVSQTVCTHDLIEWSYQIACGMNFLTTRKVLHGDLAARNVLLADNNIVKIADFGLSRQIYKNCNYQKQGQEALPVKWMAIESLIDRVFSYQSDVWSYGVTIWELFSLSKQPYPEVNELADLIRFLQMGQRMERPQLMPRAIGDIMADCWKHNREERTTFAQLEQIFGEMIQPILRQRFLDTEVTNKDPSNAEASVPMSFYLRMASAKNPLPQSFNFPPKFGPELNVTNYINTGTEINTPLQTPKIVSADVTATDDYLTVLPAIQV